MNILTSNARFRQRVVKKSYKIGVTAASKYYRISRQAIYEWHTNMMVRVGKVCLTGAIDHTITQMSIHRKKRN